MSKKPEEGPKQTLDWKIAVAATAVLVLAGIAYLSVSGIQLLSTDKDIYSPGENATVRWLSFFLSWNSCDGGADVRIFREGPGGWEDIDVQQYSSKCIDGSMSAIFMPGDVCLPMFAVPKLYNGDYTWDMRIRKNIGETTNCDGRELDRPVPNYVSAPAPPGKYKIMFGTAQKIIEIR